MEEENVALRALLCGADHEAEILAGVGYSVERAATHGEFLDALLSADRLEVPFALALSPFVRGGWEEAVKEAGRRLPELFFILRREGSGEVPAVISHSRHVIFDEPPENGVLTPIARHFASLFRENRSRSSFALAATQETAGDTRRLDTLYSIVEKLHGQRSFEVGIAAAMDEMARFVSAKTASLMVLEPGGTLRVIEALGPNRLRILGQTLKLSQSRVARHAIASGEPILITDMKDDARFGESPEEMRYRSRSVLSVPVMSREGPMAVVNFGGDASAATFTERDRDLIVTLSRQIAIALEKNRLFERLRIAVSGSIRALANAIEAKDPYTKGHSDRVTHYAVLTAQALGITPDEIEVIKQAGILHDVGKIGVPGEVLHKPSSLDEKEFRLIRRHPDIGITIVRQIGAMEQTLPIILAHHERYDGRGYPNSLGGEEIPLGARILAVADTFDAMTSNRPYRAGLSVDTAISEIVRCSGAQFDRRVAEAFVDNVRCWEPQSGAREAFPDQV